MIFSAMVTLIRFGVKTYEDLFCAFSGQTWNRTDNLEIHRTFGGMAFSLMLFYYYHTVAGVGTLVTCEITHYPCPSYAHLACVFSM